MASDKKVTTTQLTGNTIITPDDIYTKKEHELESRLELLSRKHFVSQNIQNPTKTGHSNVELFAVFDCSW